MEILLVGPDYEENLSIRYLSASLLSGGHDTILAAFNSPLDASAVANAAQCTDLVGLSMFARTIAERHTKLLVRFSGPG